MLYVYFSKTECKNKSVLKVKALLEQNISVIFMYIKIKIVVLKGMHLAKVYSIPILQQYFKKNFV